jgi:hypothetical protein
MAVYPDTLRRSSMRLFNARRRGLISCLLLFGMGAMTTACDMPPDESLDVETDTSETDSVDFETDTGPEQETDSQAYTTCLEAVMCSALNPDQAGVCLDGMDEDNQAAALNLTLCTAGSCVDYIDNFLSFGLCLFQNCPDEAMTCLGSSFIGVYY